ncbi:twin-arginine translocation pathway signal:Tat-translocated enzyme:Dyp-type peroxidase [Aureimonas endophytica]|uniref:Deferrochelatase n=1 Tax=Aureimonas endophytica TaxID=2027858 RepID=A0A917E3B1_9HYPH|nr:iron uptake transporter deferrochelatase/peroxidase subunit [Aureimonas endophytica]GGE00939.1 twin-arginine translocation pathway signal:Tat-translocated enzyme:Dyp-type peroxidase [Aureimonas endophytica]
MATDSPSPLRTSRRGLLLGAAGGAAAMTLRPAGAAAPRGGQVANAPESDEAARVQPFFGEHQPGIVTPRPAAGMIAAFDVLAKSPAEVERLFRGLTERFRFLMAGGPVPEADPRLPPADSGILGPVIAPDNLTVTLSLGASFFTGREWLAPLKPATLQRMTKFPNDALNAELCHGDLSIQICANTPDATIHALRDIIKTLPDLLVIRWKQEGAVPILQRKPGAPPESARNFLGFRDGSANPDSTDGAVMERVVWVGRDDASEPAWATGGTYQAVRIIRNFVERWDRTPLGEQERIIGRRKASGAPFHGRTEADAPDYAAEPPEAATPLDAHIRLANARNAEAERHLILRRPFNYSNGVTKNGQLDQGLLFIAYQRDLEAGFIAVQKKLDGEPLEEYIKPVGGGYFFTLPGVRDETDFLGRTLLDAAAAKS